MASKYIPSEIEPKWQNRWTEDKLYAYKGDGKKKFYTLVELPYPSGDLHIGHWFTWAAPDALSRFKRMNGFDVFFPHGFDAFGLPAENAAIKRKVHPKDWTMSNIEAMTRQLKTMGSMLDLQNVTITCLPEYYRWNQWIFLKMFERGLAYRGTAMANWCPVDQTVLAHENVEAGKCWRCGSEVEQKPVEQWFLRITEYADRLIWPQKPSVDWPTSVRVGQNNWIGRSEGVILDFGGIEVFTTRPETTDGATFLVLSPEHPQTKRLVTSKQKQDVEKYIQTTKGKSELDRKENKEKTGVFTGSIVKNPVTGKNIPVWIADYVIMGYGTGAIMAVPFADERDKEFAQKFKLPIEKTTFKASPKGKKQVNYHIRDWSISRQRYWGTPVPIIHCAKCGMVPVPEQDLPVELPYEVDFTPQGKPPLASNEEWMKVKCPQCSGDARRDAETLDTFFDSSWYFYRYVSPQLEAGPFDTKKAKELLPVDIYFGGAEHTLGHTLYARFFTMFFKDLGLIDFDEFALKRVQHGIVLGPDGAKMSKSKGNVINPDEVVAEYGADSVRLYLNFMMAYEDTSAWSTTAIAGVYRFLKRVWGLLEKVAAVDPSKDDEVVKHKAIKKVGEDLASIKANTAVAALMEWLNHLSRKDTVSKSEYRTFLVLLAPFAPHITEELWEKLGEKYSIHNEEWPKVDMSKLIPDTIKIPVQVNGKLRTVLQIDAAKSDEKDIVEAAMQDEKVKQHVTGKKTKAIYIKGKLLNLVAS